MDESQIDRLLNTLLYEGYALYPYRPSLKNTQRWTFGTLYPQAVCETLQAGDQWRMQASILACSPMTANFHVEIRFLQPISNTSQADHSQDISTWQSSIERRLVVPSYKIEQLLHEPVRHSFEFPIADDGAVLVAHVELSAGLVADDVVRLTTSVSNLTPIATPVPQREDAYNYCLASTHILFCIEPGQFFSLIDPPSEWSAASASCHNENCWPVLLGGHKLANAMLASPLILYDDPQIAAASHGDLFDATEIDEMLSLRIQTLTPAEKEQMAGLDERTRRLLERTEALAEPEMQQLHAAACQLPFSSSPTGDESPFPHFAQRPESIEIAGQSLRVGDFVRLRPQRRADIFDLALQGQVAQIAAIEQDFENRVHLAVCVVDDPGADIGLAGKIGHRFFFQPDEVEPLSECPS